MRNPDTFGGNLVVNAVSYVNSMSGHAPEKQNAYDIQAQID